ncbi:hypothetical protein BFN67_13760 [Pseudaminobacter manganicus]|uniref:Uncharacterized protein n=2 Tax=Manganibacter manganicus TaxID=1873176 RepID=A0A1V8RTI0_9HYPH|nr:hypothetical protein BFN67_13760 [Pseudaminobacter manganicus]
MSRRLVEGLIFGKDSLPQYAGTRQRVLSAMLELDAGKPTRIWRTEASIWEFDQRGGIREGLHQALALAMELMPTPQTDDTVVELRPHTKKKKLEKEYRWEPQKSDIDLIIADIWPKKKADRLKSVTGVAKRKPALTWDARQALDEVSASFWKIPMAIERLKEPSQKSFGCEARERAHTDPDFGHLYRAIADMSDWYLEVQKRKRTGKGVWYGMVEVMLWRDGVGEAAERHFEKCGSRDDAVLVVRRLLAEHAPKFNDYTTVEAELLTDLEWEKRDYSD